MALSANRNIVRMADPDLRGLEVAAGEHIYRSGFVGIHPATGYAKPFEPGDLFIGVADNEADNSSGVAGDTAETTGKHGTCQVWIAGEFEHTRTRVGQADVGRAVYATDDGALATSGHPDAFVGRVVRKSAANTALIQIRRPGERPVESDTGSVEFVYDGEKMVTPTGATAGPTYSLGLELDSVLGLGVLNVAGGGIDLQVDAVAEVAQASIATPVMLDVSEGMTFEGRLHLPDIGNAAALDVDFGFANVWDDTVKADMDDGTLTKHVRFHMDGNSANILAESDDGTTDVAAVDTTLDNVTTAGAFKDFLIVVRKDGTAELYIDGARVLAATAFGVSATGTFAGFVNLEKTSDDLTAKVRIDRLRIAGVPA